MAHTDKDMPYWVTAEWYESYHMCSLGTWNRREEPCNLPTTPIRQRRTISAWRAKSCIWVACWERRRVSIPDRETLRTEWHCPQRRAVRDDSRRAIAEYRAAGEVDIVHDIRQARHGVSWYM